MYLRNVSRDETKRKSTYWKYPLCTLGKIGVKWSVLRESNREEDFKDKNFSELSGKKN